MYYAIFCPTLNKDFNNNNNKNLSDICDWYVDDKLNIHFGEDKTNSILF